MATGLVLGLFMLSGTALASPPVIATDGANATSGSSATVSGNGDPGGPSTSIHADYALASEVWCTSQGAEGTPHETGHHELGSGNVEISEILVELTGLNPASAYCAELVAENEDGADHGGQVTFTTPTPPSIHSESASHITSSDATLEAQINTEGLETGYQFQLRSPVCKPPAECIPIIIYSLPSGKLLGSFVDQSVSLDLNSAGVTLQPGKEYFYSVKATNAAGNTEARWQTFEPPAGVIDPPSPDGVSPPRGGQSGASSSGDQPAGSGGSPGTSTPDVKTTDLQVGKTVKPKPLTREQKLARALRACKSKRKALRASCVRLAHERYGHSHNHKR